MISFKSFNCYFIINGFLFLLGLLQYNAILFYCNDINEYTSNFLDSLNHFLIIFAIFILRNYAILNFIEYSIKNKPNITDKSLKGLLYANNGFVTERNSVWYNNVVSKIPKEEYKYEFHINVLTTTSVEAMTHVFIKNRMIDTNLSRYIFHDFIYFIPFSFIFEVIFDFFHYFTHRLLHHKYLYKYLHKKHHKFAHPTSILTFYQEPFDLLITNSIPTILTLLIFPYISNRQFHFITVYKTFIEISGHSGKISNPTCSFPQFIWLPKMLSIELYTEDHDLHHSLNNCNYAKRFSLWDKVFHTYQS